MFLSRLRPTPAISATTLSISLGLTSISALILLRCITTNALRTSPTANEKKWIDSPLKTIHPHLTPQQKSQLIYLPNALPGARDVETPYGSIRVYEWGPEDGERVLFVHGISTPSVAFANLATQMVERGHRVILFDLFGRGFSAAPLLPYDARLYTTQILLVLASCNPPTLSPVHIIGYSLGGCLAASFTRSHPHLTRSLTVIAPAGLLRYADMSLRTRFMYHPTVQSLLPRWYVERFVRRRLWSDPTTEAVVGPVRDTDVVTVGEAEADAITERDAAAHGGSVREWTPSACNAVVNESLEQHRGLPLAFISSLQYAPIYEQEREWAQIACKVLMILGKRDPIVKPAELVERFEGCVAADRRRTVLLDAGHEVPVSQAGECAETILDFYGDL